MSTTWSLLISLVLLGLNAFFVAAEFALVAAKRHRLEQSAATGSRAARAALAGTRELSMMLAGAQLGITLCTLGLGALAKPTVAGLLRPAFEATGLPEDAAYVIAFVIAVSAVAFLHVVVGEMAPKSWSISHPETSALLLALPFRVFTRATRPALVALNGLANACLRAVRVTPQNDLAQAHGAQELRMLIEASGEHGTLEAAEHELLTALLQLQDTTVRQVMTPIAQAVSVPAGMSARRIELTSRASGRSRLLVTEPAGRIAGFVHVRDAARATTFEPDAGSVAADLMTAALVLPDNTRVARAVRIMREHRTQLALVTGGSPETPVGLVALEDILEEILGEFDDETDPIPAAASPFTSRGEL